MEWWNDAYFYNSPLFHHFRNTGFLKLP